jgi:hypothetical protein
VRLSRAVLPAVAAVLTFLTAYPLCNLVFACGCRWVFGGGDAHCDMRVPGPPDCPVCTVLPIGVLFAGALFAGWLFLLHFVRRFSTRVKEA